MPPGGSTSRERGLRGAKRVRPKTTKPHRLCPCRRETVGHGLSTAAPRLTKMARIPWPCSGTGRGHRGAAPLARTAGPNRKRWRSDRGECPHDAPRRWRGRACCGAGNGSGEAEGEGGVGPGHMRVPPHRRVQCRGDVLWVWRCISRTSYGPAVGHRGWGGWGGGRRAWSPDATPRPPPRGFEKQCPGHRPRGACPGPGTRSPSTCLTLDDPRDVWGPWARLWVRRRGGGGGGGSCTAARSRAPLSAQVHRV